MLSNKKHLVIELVVATIVVTAVCLIFPRILFPKIVTLDRADTRSSTISAFPQVCAEIYSGRPDPCWVLTQEETDKLINKIKTTSDAKWFERNGNLGYRGLDVFFSGKNNLLPENNSLIIYIYNGKISYNKDAAAMADNYAYINEPNPHLIYKTDEDKQIEGWLLATARGKILEADYEAMLDGRKTNETNEITYPAHGSIVAAIGPKQTEYRFEVYAMTDTTSPHIDVYKNNSTKPIWTLVPTINSWFSKDLVGSFKLSDVNFDGFDDAGVRIDGGATWGAYQYWVFDPKTETFISTPYTNNFQTIGYNSIKFDKQNKKITTYDMLGAVGTMRTIYRVAGDEINKISELTYENLIATQAEIDENPSTTFKIVCQKISKTYSDEVELTTTTSTINGECPLLR